MITTTEPIIGTLERGDINGHIERLLNDLGDPEPPLKLESVRELLQLDLTYYSKENLNILDEMVHRAKMAGKRITSTAKNMQDLINQHGLKGILMLKEGDKKIFIDSDVAELKRRFIIAHEILHDLLPWHRSLLIGDNEMTLNPTFYNTMEAEANYGGRKLMFLGDQFQSEALDCEFNWDTIDELKKRYGNTFTTTLWHIVCERDPNQPAFGLISKHPYYPNTCIKAGTENVAYFPRSKKLIEQFPNLTHDEAFAAVKKHATRSKKGPVGEGESLFYDVNGQPHVFEMFSFCNTYDLLSYGVYKMPHNKLIGMGGL